MHIKYFSYCVCLLIMDKCTCIVAMLYLCSSIHLLYIYAFHEALIYMCMHVYMYICIVKFACVYFSQLNMGKLE